MAKAKAIVKCIKCGEEYTVTKDCFNRKEADSWEEYMVNNPGLCKKCWGAEQREKEAERPLTLVVDIDPYAQTIVLHFEGNTKPQKDDIKALGYRWGDLPMRGTFGVFQTRPKIGWFKVIRNIDDIAAEFEKAASLKPVLKNNVTDVDLMTWQAVISKNAEKQSEYESEKALLVKPIVPEKLLNKRWNGKIYGKAGNYSIYLDNEYTKISDAEKEEIEKYQIAKGVYFNKLNELKQKYGISC